MPTQTPAARRFVPPSSTSTSRIAKRPPFSSQFGRTAQSSSSPFIRTHVTRPSRDDIIFQDLEDEDDNVRPISVTSNAGKEVTSLSDVDESPEETGLSGVQSGGHRQSKTFTHTHHLLDSTTKRRKLSHPTQAADGIEDANVLSSSPPVSPLQANDYTASAIEVPGSSPEIPEPDNEQLADHQIPNYNPCEQDTSPTTSPAKPIATPKRRSSRFRHLPTVKAPSVHLLSPHHTDQPLPSFQSRLLASTTSSLRGPQPALDFTLPDAFSPSRRRGQREYIRGGHAETVRGWVLDVAARTGQAAIPSTHKVQARSGRDGFEESGRSETHVTIQNVLVNDRDSRFAIIKTTEHASVDGGFESKGDLWMLINTDVQHANRSGPSTSKLRFLRPGAELIVKGASSCWDIDLDHIVPGSSDTSSAHNLKCRVALLWDVT